MEGRVRRRRPARAGRHRGRGPGLRQLPDVLALPREGLSLDDADALNRQTYEAIAALYEQRYPAEPSAFLLESLELLHAEVTAGGRVLDLGCGPGRHVALLAQRGFDAVGVDASLAMLRAGAARAGGRLLCGDLRALPLVGASADGAWSSYALLHLDDGDLLVALREVHRVLRPGGVAVLVTASTGSGREPVAYAPGRERVFFARSEQLLAALCRRAGLEVLSSATEREEWRAPVRVVARRPLPSAS